MKQRYNLLSKTEYLRNNTNVQTKYELTRHENIKVENRIKQ